MRTRKLFNLLIVIAGSFLLVQCHTKSPDIGELEQGFINPSIENRPLALWPWLNGFVDTTKLVYELAEMKNKGMRGAVIWDIGALVDPDKMIPEGPAFLSDQSLEYISLALKEFQEQFPQEDIILRSHVSDDVRAVAQKEAVGYYGHILALDKCMGELQKATDESGIAENTIVVFTSDHGEMMGSQGVRPRQKQVPWAESVKIPFLLRYPARFGNKKIVVDAPINVPDVLPTLLSLAGLPVPPTIEGENMVAAIDNPATGKDKAALIMNVSPFAGKADEYRGVYTSRYAYVKSLDSPWFLFDHGKDPLQMDNLLDKPGYEQLQKEMDAILQRELTKVGDEFRPRQYYIDKWGYKLTKGGHISYSKGATFQGPGLSQ